ncbi:MAG: LysM domain-containing protein [Gammaproteobacteria bacterium]
MQTPITSTNQGPAKAMLEIVRPQGQPAVPIHFNPTEYQIQKSNSFAEIAIPGLETPPLQFVRGAVEKLTTELLVDTSDTLEDVREKYTDRLRDLMRIKSDLHAPPIVRLVWDKDLFTGVVDKLSITYVMFTPQGVPIRAKLNLSLMEYRPVEEQVDDPPRNSPDVDKAHVVRRGDTLANVAYLAYNDPTEWRQIAINNDILDPRELRPGEELQIPRLR